MKIDKTTYKDRKVGKLGMTADYICRPDIALFLPTHIAHIVKPHMPTHKPKLAKECNLPNPELKNYE